jgi:hypothetical protein
LNQNWIVENLNNAFSTWNGKLTELWGLVTTSPQTFKGGAVWGVMQSLHNAMIGIHEREDGNYNGVFALAERAVHSGGPGK